MDQNTIQRKPRPVLPVINAVSTVLYIIVTALHAVIQSPAYVIALWAFGALLFGAITLPLSIRTHRSAVETWRLRGGMR